MERVIRIYLTISGLLFCLSAFGQPNKIVVVNRNVNWKNMSIAYYETTSMKIVNFDEIKSFYLLDSNRLSFVLPSHHPIFFSFSWDFKRQNVCAFPGDTLEFVSTPNSPLPFRFFGSRPNSEFMFYSYLEEHGLGVTVFNSMEVTGKLDFHGVADLTCQRYEARLRFLEGQILKNPFTKKGERTIRQPLCYQYLSELFFPYNAWYSQNDWMIKAAKVPCYYKEKLRALTTEFNKDSL